MTNYPKIDTATDIPFSKFGMEVTLKLLEFHEHYKKKHQENPEEWPAMTSEQLWWETFLGYLGFI